jgi:hypothetical protein
VTRCLKHDTPFEWRHDESYPGKQWSVCVKCEAEQKARFNALLKPRDIDYGPESDTWEKRGWR